MDNTYGLVMGEDGQVSRFINGHYSGPASEVEVQVFNSYRDCITQITCTGCGDTKDRIEDVLDVQEWLEYKTVGGYNSVIGDGVKWEVILCQSCIRYLSSAGKVRCVND